MGTKLKNQTKMKNHKYNWTRIKSDKNGNPRFVINWLDFGVKSYEAAIDRAIGGAA